MVKRERGEGEEWGSWYLLGGGRKERTRMKLSRNRKNRKGKISTAMA